MNLEERIEQIEQDVRNFNSSLRLTNEVVAVFNNPEEVKRLFDALVKGADAMAETKGKVDRMEKEIDSNDRRTTALIVGLYILCATTEREFL